MDKIKVRKFLQASVVITGLLWVLFGITHYMNKVPEKVVPEVVVSDGHPLDTVITQKHIKFENEVIVDENGNNVTVVVGYLRLEGEDYYCGNFIDNRIQDEDELKAIEEDIKRHIVMAFQQKRKDLLDEIH